MSAATRAVPVGASATSTAAAAPATHAAWACSRPRRRGMTSSLTKRCASIPSRLYARREREVRFALRPDPPPAEAGLLRGLPRRVAARRLVAGVHARVPPALARRSRRGDLVRVLRRDGG